MMFTYNQVKERPTLLLAMTGLTQAEFDQLLPHFQCAWDQYVQQNYVDRDDRQRQYGGGRPELTLVTIEEKLLFILYYVKVYPLQEILAFEFGMVQSTANEWIHMLSEVWQKALDHGGYLPERDPEKQKHYDSGKKNAHDQASGDWWTPYAQSQLLEPNL